jgi:uncharacterized protein (TIGR03435 family)
MKKFMLWMIAFAMLAGSALHAQDATGTWQGVMQMKSGNQLRTVLKVTKTVSGNLKGKFYNLDQHWQSLDNDPVTLQGNTFTFEVPERGLKYAGKLNPDGASITGMIATTSMMTGDSGSAPLNMKRVTDAEMWALPVSPSSTEPMAADADPSFEVATIKPTAPGDHGDGMNLEGRRLTILRISLSSLVNWAYDIVPKQIAGAPDWMETDQYDIAAVIDTDGIPNEKQMSIMLQKLLKDRFNLSFHYEKKELPAYTLVAGKLGPKITKSESGPNDDTDFMGHGLGHKIARNMTMAQFAHGMQGIVGRPVLDKTGLTGRYDFTLDWTPDETQYPGSGFRIPPPPADGSAPLPALFTAMQEQLGIKLVSTKTKVDVLVIDHVEQPSAN